jgi:hypothetical protein
VAEQPSPAGTSQARQATEGMRHLPVSALCACTTGGECLRACIHLHHKHMTYSSTYLHEHGWRAWEAKKGASAGGSCLRGVGPKPPEHMVREHMVTERTR